MYTYLIVFFIKYVKWKINLNSVTDIWNTVNKLNKAFAMRAGAHRSYLQALKKLADNWPTMDEELGKLLLIVLGKRHVKYTEFWAA